MDDVVLRTERLVLRNWRDEDRDEWAAMNADPEVMRHFPSTMTREESDTSLDRWKGVIAETRWGLWAAEVPGEAPFIGFIGLAVPRFEAHFTPTVEVGWRLARRFWGRGYAPEGAEEALRFAFEELGEREIVSMTTAENRKSQRVMEKLGMHRDPADDFDHPTAPADWPERRHVLYRLSADEWRRRRAGR